MRPHCRLAEEGEDSHKAALASDGKRQSAVNIRGGGHGGAITHPFATHGSGSGSTPGLDDPAHQRRSGAESQGLSLRLKRDHVRRPVRRRIAQLDVTRVAAAQPDLADASVERGGEHGERLAEGRIEVVRLVEERQRCYQQRVRAGANSGRSSPISAADDLALATAHVSMAAAIWRLRV